MLKLRGVSTLLLVLGVGGLVVAPSSDAYAVCPVIGLVGDGSTSGNARAPSVRYRYARAVYLITATEFAGSGLLNGSITGIGWLYQTAPGLVGAAPLKVYLQNTTDTTNTKSTTWSTAISGMTLVHDATTTLPNATIPFDIPFSGGSPFSYTGAGLYVAFDWGQYTGTLSTTAVVACNSTGLANGLNGAQSNTSAPTTLTASAFRPETRLTGTVHATNVSVDFLTSMGVLPLGLTGPESIRATVFQLGDLDLTDVPVTLNITGADTFSSTVTVPSLGKCGTSGQVATFAPFTPTLMGRDLEVASVPADDFPANDTLSLYLDVTANRYSYAHPNQAPEGGVGLSNNTGEFVARFSPTSPTQVDSVSLAFFASSATTYRIVLRADDGTGKPGALLYLDAADRTVTAAGSTVITLPVPIAVGSGNFFAGIRQTNTTNASFSFNYEYPIRDSTFFYSTTPDSGPWTDFSGANLYYQLNVGVVLGNCLVPLSVSISPTGTTPLACDGSVEFTATPGGGTGPYTHQWTEDGVEIPGATASTYTATHDVGTHTYNCKVSDAGGCIGYQAASDSVATWGPAAAVSGDASICSGGAATIYAALTGSPPWDLTWSDGFVQSGVGASPATRVVSPAGTTTYTVTAVSDASCAGTSSGSATVSVTTTPGETAPGPNVSDEMRWTGASQLDWPANPDATSYTLYRGTAADLPRLQTTAVDSCTRYQGAATSATGLTESPPVGDIYWYVVTGTAGGGCEGTAGADRMVDSAGPCP